MTHHRESESGLVVYQAGPIIGTDIGTNNFVPTQFHIILKPTHVFVALKVEINGKSHHGQNNSSITQSNELWVYQF